MRTLSVFLVGLQAIACHKPPDEVASDAQRAPPRPSVRHAGVSVTVPEVAWPLEAHTPGADTWTATLRDPAGGCEGRVTLTPADAADPRAAATTARDAASSEATCQLVADEAVLYNGKSGFRWELRCTEAGADGVPRVHGRRHTTVVRVDEAARRWRVTVDARSAREDYVARRRCLDAVTAAVAVLPGGDAGRHGQPDP